MNNTSIEAKYFFIPYLAVDYKYLEKYLEEKAKDGYLLDSLKLFYGKFIKSEGQYRKYRIVPQAGLGIDNREISFYEDSNWKSAGTIGNQAILYTECETEELFTDTSSYEHRIRWFKRSIIFTCIMYVVLIMSMFRNITYMVDLSNAGAIHLIGSCFASYPLGMASIITYTVVFVAVILKCIGSFTVNPNDASLCEKKCMTVYAMDTILIFLTILACGLMIIQGI